MKFGNFWRPEEALVIRWTAFALFVSAGPINILLHGLLGTGSVITATVLLATLGALFVFGDWRSLKPDFCDLCFIAFVGYAAASSLIHPWADAKEISLLAITLLAYCAGRLLGPRCFSPVFPMVTLTIAAIGAAFMVAAMLQGSMDHVGKPLLFGSISGAPLQLAIPFVLAVGAMLAREKFVIRLLPLALIALLAAAFAASMVRFVFVAAFGALLVLALVSGRATRRLVVGAIVALVVTVAIGLAARPDTALKYKELAIQALSSNPATAATNEKCPPIDEANSIEVRKTLYREWARLIPESGLIGIGLGGFTHLSCRPNEAIHNTLLHIALEFGWPAAALFCFVLATAFSRLFQARAEESARFGLFALTFLVLMSMAHGVVSQERVLFLFLGYAVAQRREKSI